MANVSHREVEFMDDDENELVHEEDVSSTKKLPFKEDYRRSILSKSYLSSLDTVMQSIMQSMNFPHFYIFLLSVDKILNLSPFKWSVIGIVVCFSACLTYHVLGADRVSCITSLDDIKLQLRQLKEKFPSQDITLWSGIFSGLINLNKNPAEPAVYLLAFDEDSVRSLSCIVEIITTLATKLLQPCETRKWLLLNGTQLSKSISQDPGDLIDAISREKEHSRIVIVPDVQKIPAKLAQGFHSLVDTYDALMSKKPAAVYIFTLLIPRMDDVSNITNVVEDILLINWKDLDRDVLQPLVTRVSHFVLPVSKESQAQLCPLKIDSTIAVEIP